MRSDVLQGIRDACARVMERARFVAIDRGALAALGAGLERAPEPESHLDPVRSRLADDAATVAFVLTLDAINFGSGWFPRLRKRPGCSGYFTIAGALEQRFVSRGAWSAAELRRLSGAECTRLLGQDPADREVAELRTPALVTLGSWRAEPVLANLSRNAIEVVPRPPGQR